MNKRTITKEFKNVYGNNGPLSFMKQNRNMNSLLQEIPDKNGFENNVTKNFENVSEPSEPPYWIIIIIIIILLSTAVYYFRDMIYNFIFPNKPITPTTQQPTTQQPTTQQPTTQQPTTQQLTTQQLTTQNTKQQTTLQTIKTEEEKQANLQDKITKGGVTQLNNSINTVSPFKQEQLVKANSYCYIGTDNGHRECTNAFDGDVCMSGQIFPKMAVCVNPNLKF